jgi:hypothetical protein
MGLGIVFALVVALPLFIWGIVSQKFLINQRAGGQVIIDYSVQEPFTGTGALDLSKWGASGTPGFAAVMESDRLKISIPSGNDNIGGNDAVVFPYINSQISSVTGDFVVSVDLAEIDSTAGWQQIKFWPSSAIAIRRTKIGTSETIDVFTSPSNGPPWTKSASVDLAPNTGSVKVKMVRVGNEIETHYDLGSGFVSLLNISADGYSNEASLPTLGVENVEPEYPGTIAYFDNFSFDGQVYVDSTPTPSPSGITNSCGGTCGTNYDCASGLFCYTGFCRNPACQSSLDCSCSGTPTPTATPTPSPTPNVSPPVCTQSSIPPAMGSAPLNVTLHGSGNAGSGVGIDGYRWDFENDGSWDTGISLDPVTHTYPSAGTYRPTYQIRNVNGIYSTVCTYSFSVIVYPPGSPPPTSRPFQVLLKFQGVNDDSAHLSRVAVRFVSGALVNYPLGLTLFSPQPVVYVGQGVYRLNFGVWSADLPPASDFALIIKGEKHLGVKFCSASGQTSHCAGTNTGKIAFPANPGQMVNLDFTGIPLPPGDVNPQDGYADINDLNIVKGLLSKSCSALTDEDRLMGDLDFSGCVNTKDIFLMLQNMSKFDEN